MASLKRGQRREESVPRDSKRGPTSKGRGEWRIDSDGVVAEEQGGIG